jgi:hypothetical protein
MARGKDSTDDEGLLLLKEEDREGGMASSVRFINSDSGISIPGNGGMVSK